MSWLLRLLGLADATRDERRATLWTATMFGTALASTFVLRPLRDQFGVDQGTERMPFLYGLTLLVTTLFAPAFWAIADRWPSRRFVPIALQAAAVSMAVLFVGLWLVGSYDWKAPGARWVGDGFWGFYSALNVAVPSLVWIHAVEHFRREQGLRLFGLLGVGGTLGAVVGSELARRLSGLGLPPSSAAIVAGVLLELTFVCYLVSQRACARMAGPTPARTGERASRGGLLAGLRLLGRDRQLQSIGAYMVLLGMVATAFYVAQTELVGEQVSTARAQHGWLANQELWSQSLVLGLQLFCTGHLLRRLPAALFLCLMPTVSVVGLGAVWLWPTAAAIAVVQILRRGAQFAFEKPAREVLYTPLDVATKHKVKFLLDTFALRLGDLLGAGFQVWILRGSGGLGRGGILVATVVLAAAWAVFGFGLGRRSERAARQGLPHR